MKKNGSVQNSTGKTLGTSATYIIKKDFETIINNLYPENKLIMQIAYETGIRISDVLKFRIGDVRQNKRFRIVESKTGKSKWVYIPANLRKTILQTRPAGRGDAYYVFEGRLSPLEHRTRQAVWKDMKRVLRDICVTIDDCSPHTARKIYAVEKYRESGDIEKVQKLLNHDYKSTTLLYALSDIL